MSVRVWVCAPVSVYISQEMDLADQHAECTITCHTSQQTYAVCLWLQKRSIDKYQQGASRDYPSSIHQSQIVTDGFNIWTQQARRPWTIKGPAGPMCRPYNASTCVVSVQCVCGCRREAGEEIMGTPGHQWTCETHVQITQ